MNCNLIPIIRQLWFEEQYSEHPYSSNHNRNLYIVNVGKVAREFYIQPIILFRSSDIDNA